MSQTDWRAIDDSLLNPEWYTQPEHREVFRFLRDEAPVRLVESPRYDHPFWGVTRYEDAKACIEDGENFSHKEGTRIPRAPQRLDPERKHAYGFDADMSYLDDPAHALYRRPFNKHFSVPGVAYLGSAIEEYVDEILDGIQDQDEVEFISDVAGQLPVMVIGHLLGIPREDWAHVKLAATRNIQSHNPKVQIDGDPAKTYAAGHEAVKAYAAELALDRRANPRDDFASAIAQMRVDNDLLSTHEMTSLIRALLLGGFDTTRHAIGVGVWQLIQRPDFQEEIRSDKKAAVAATDETIRFSNPARNLIRVATKDVQVGDQRVRAGDWVGLFITSANRDERKFENPDVFDIHRQNAAEHLSFGEGGHKCLGRNVVRLELGIFFQKLFSRLPNLEVVGEPQWIPDISAGGLTELNVRVGSPALV